MLQLLKPGLGGVLWRTHKADLAPAELGIPAQTSHITSLSLSSVERFFYSRQHQACSGCHVLRLCALYCVHGRPGACSWHHLLGTSLTRLGVKPLPCATCCPSQERARHSKLRCGWLGVTLIVFLQPDVVAKLLFPGQMFCQRLNSNFTCS